MAFWQALGDALDRWAGPGGIPSDLADETGAHLDGRLLERCWATGWRAPGWLWLNAVAHGEPELLHELAVAPGGRAAGAWQRVRAGLAAELLSVAGNRPTEVRRIQTELLVPLESRLSRLPDLIPGELHTLVTDELRRALPGRSG